MLAIGWPVTFATDIAVSYFIARIIFRPHPAIPFLLLLAIASDVLGFWRSPSVIPRGRSRLGGGALIMAVAHRRGLRHCDGPESEASGPICSLQAVFPGTRCSGADCIRRSRSCRSCRSCRTPRAIPDSSSTPARPRGMRSVNSSCWWRYPAQVALFFFGLVNAGVPFHALEAGTWGCRSRSSSASRSASSSRPGSPSPPACTCRSEVGWRELIVVGFAAAIGFSIGLFFCAALLPTGPAALGNRHGRAPEPRRSGFRRCGRKSPARRQIRTITDTSTFWHKSGIFQLRVTTG